MKSSVVEPTPTTASARQSKIIERLGLLSLSFCLSRRGWLVVATGKRIGILVERNREDAVTFRKLRPINVQIWI